MNKLNITNKLLTISDIQNILRIGGVNQKINSIKHYQRAFTHKSYVGNDNKSYDKRIVPLQKYSNERYEFGGDSIISQSVCLYLLERYPTQDEGFLTNVKIRLVERNALAHYAKKLDFSQWILVSKYMEDIHGRSKNKILEDVYESFIYAIYLDLGKQYAEEFVINIVEKFTDFAGIISNDINYKQQILRKFHKQGWNAPTYITENEIGPIYSKTFVVSSIDAYGFKLGTGVDKTKKEAEQIASKEAIKNLDKINEKLENLSYEDMLQLKNKIKFSRFLINEDKNEIYYMINNVEKKINYNCKTDNINENYIILIEYMNIN